ncbi:LysR family transcriptional regulator [Falsiroseomonas sp. HW251]|uniref:LysR family transcriptional regulator n=1 Tax=Falsiroseomonas sp. HW251 TaxID=3390998 RepID=UPI003D31FAAC
MKDFSWDDAKAFAAVVEAGSWRRGAQRLGLGAATVSRRVEAFEAWIGEKLLERRPDGVRLTPRGEAVAAALDGMREAADQVRRATAARPVETVRVTTTASMCLMLTRHLPALMAATPGVVISLLPSRAVLSLARREAEIAIRMRTPPAEGKLVIRRLATVRIALYAAETLVPTGTVPDFSALPIIGVARSEQSRTAAALRRILGDRPPAAILDDTPLRLQACAAGLGVAILPCQPADATPGLRRVAELPELDEDAFLVIHEDLAASRPVRALAEALAALFRRERAALLGQSTMKSVAPFGVEERCAASPKSETW